MRTLGLDIFEGIDLEQRLRLTAAADFDNFFIDWGFAHDREEMGRQVALGKTLGLTCDCSHSTIPGSELLWADHPDVERVLDNFFLCMDNAAALEIPVVVIHCSPEYEPEFALGIKRFERLVEYAKKKGLRIALENTRGADWLVKTLAHFEGCDTVGFCYDSGHEAFCTPGFRFLPKIGHRLIYTHLHDNLIVGDHHLLPWDGKIGFDRVVGELRDCGYQGNLTLELNYTPYVDKLSPEDYVKQCFGIACRLAKLLDG